MFGEDVLTTEELVTLQSWQKQTTWKTLTVAAVAAATLAAPVVASAAVSSTTAVTASPSTATTGQSVELDATVTCAGDPTGGLGVTFFDGSNLLDTVAVGADGVATYSTSFASTGAHTITAAYNGNDNCSASNGTTTVQVTQAPTPPTPPSALCLLVCNSLVNLTIQNVGNVGNAGDIYNINNINQAASPHHRAMNGS